MEIDTSTAHPNPIPDAYHRKIELQSPLDLTYLQNNLSTSARQKLDLHFPPSALRKQPQAQPATIISLDGKIDTSTQVITGSEAKQNEPSDSAVDTQEEEDPLRARVRSLVDAFLTRTWTGACANITINGLDASSQIEQQPNPRNSNGTSHQNGQPNETGEEREGIDFTYAAYDARLQQKVASLHAEVELLTAQVSKLRREAPKKGAEMYREQLHEQIQKDDAEEEQYRNQPVGQEDVLKLDEMRDGWHDETKAMYERGVRELARLSGLAGVGEGGSLTETLGKVQRATTVAMELE